MKKNVCKALGSSLKELLSVIIGAVLGEHGHFRNCLTKWGVFVEWSGVHNFHVYMFRYETILLSRNVNIFSLSVTFLDLQRSSKGFQHYTWNGHGLLSIALNMEK